MVHLQVLAPDDWQQWRTLRLLALEESPTAFGSTLAEWQGVGDGEERWRGRLTGVAYNVIAHMGDEDETVGMVSGGWNGSDVELMSLWVRPRARGHGVGDRLVQTVVQWARGQQAWRVVLSVRDHNVSAIRLYRRHGFQAIGPSTESEPGSPETLFARRI